MGGNRERELLCSGNNVAPETLQVAPDTRRTTQLDDTGDLRLGEPWTLEPITAGYAAGSVA